MPNHKMLLVGKINGIFGIKGWVKIFSYTENKNNICQYLPLYPSKNSQELPLEIETIKPHGKTIIAKIDGINNPDQAQLLLGKQLYINAKQRPKTRKNEYYWSDLVGLNVINQADEPQGVVKDLLSTGANDVLVIQWGDKKYLVPYVATYIISIDLNKKQMVLDWQSHF